MTKNKRKLLSVLMALALLFQSTSQTMAINTNNQDREEVNIEEIDTEGTDVEEVNIEEIDTEGTDVEEANIEEIDTEVADVEEINIEEKDVEETDIEADGLVDVDQDQVIQDLEDDGIAFVNGWVLFDINGNELPQGRNFQGAMRNVGRMPSSSHDLRHVSSVWSVAHNNGITRYEAFINGRWVAAFCTQPGVPSAPDSDPLPGWNEGFGSLTISERRTISLILMHGYDHIHGFNIPEGSNELRHDAYVTTQVAVWEVVLGFWDVNTPWYGNSSIPSSIQGDPWRRLISDTGQTSGASLQQAIGNSTRMNMYDQMRSDIWTFHGQTPVANRRPSFTGADPSNFPIHTLTWSHANQRFQVILDDSLSAGGNGLLNRYIGGEIGSFGEYRWYREGRDQITIYTTNPNAPQTNAPSDLLKIQPTNTLPVMFWTHPVLQDKAIGNFNVPLTAYFGVRVEAIGNLEIVKYSETGVRIPNTVFRVVSDEVNTVITTNVDGIATLSNIPTGIFEVTEIYVPFPWVVSDETFTIEVTGNTNQVVTNRLTVTNELSRGSFELIKLSGRYMDNNENDDLWLLPDVAFSLYSLGNESGNSETEPYYLATLITDEHGRITKDGLLYGSYKLVEVVTHYRHQLLGDPIFFQISEHRQHHELVVYNDQTQTQILKVDHLGNPLPGAHFQLLMYGAEEVIHEWISTEYAEILFALAHGNYILREVAAPAGFLLGEDIHFTVTDAARTIYIIADNLLDSRVYIATQAHTGNGSNQYFTSGSVVNMFDDIEITHININPGSSRAFRAYLFARLPNGNIEQIWYTDYIEYSVEYLPNFNISEPNITTAQVNTTIDTSEFPQGTTFFWAETAYHQIQNEDGSYSWEADYRHNFDGSDKRQTLFPIEPDTPRDPEPPAERPRDPEPPAERPKQPTPPILPQTGTHTRRALWIQLSALGLGVGLARYKKKGNDKQLIN